MQKAIQTVIIKRFMSEKNLKEFLEEYETHKQKRTRMNREVTPFDRKVWKSYKSGKMIGELVKEFGKNRSTLLYSIALAAKE